MHILLCAVSHVTHKLQDNCKTDKNPGQEDSEEDGIGNVCDNCPDADNFDQENSDGDAKGNVCDDDDDNDGNRKFAVLNKINSLSTSYIPMGSCGTYQIKVV